MGIEGFFEGLGEAIGAAIRYVVDALKGIFDWIIIAGYNFLEGLSSALGIDRSVLGIGGLIVGLVLIVTAFRAFFRRAVVSGLIWLFLGLWLLSWLIY
ncbi:hypothetical protein [Azomonas macrocytogenes]|uniref:Uncharacterized protein n=1 Tax=Azomonas macrocytogenes TaxID=69962 RepID=A0A839T1V9_AZOMA|nr:hypothetical protein [Azomonas macrocytogenes]MBB3102949.1 hypothetical protein [Azomonas macrocytogenes]